MNGKELLDFARQNEGIDVRIARKNNLNLINYLHLGVDWNNEKYRSIRSIVIDDDGEIIQQGYQKFFNHDELIEREDMLSETKELSKWQEGIDFYVTEKIDGSYIKISNYKGELIITSSGSFEGEHVTAVKRYLETNVKPEQMGFLHELGENYTLLFEYVSPEYNLTVPYSSENLLLHGLVKTKTGLELAMSDVELIARGLSFNSVQKLNIENLEQLVKMQKTVKDFEGWVVSFYNGVRLKFKTDWFFEAHEINSIFFGRARTKKNIRFIYDMYITNELDDFISMCTKKSKTDLIDLSVEVIDSVRDFDKNIKSIRNTLKENSISDENRIKILDIFNDKYLVHLAFLVIDDKYLSKEKEKFVLNKVKEITQ